MKPILDDYEQYHLCFINELEKMKRQYPAGAKSLKLLITQHHASLEAYRALIKNCKKGIEHENQLDQSEHRTDQPGTDQ